MPPRRTSGISKAEPIGTGANDFRFTRRQWRETFAADDTDNLDRLRRQILDSERLRERARTLLRELEERSDIEFRVRDRRSDRLVLDVGGEGEGDPAS